MSALEVLLARVRRRLWAQRLAVRLARSTWPASALLLAAGTLHAAWREVAPGTALALAALPAVVALLHGAWRDRPDATAVGRQADAWFGGDDLLLSAADGCTATAGGSALLRERAERAAKTALDDRHGWPAGSLRFHPLPLLAALAGLFLLSLPGRGAPPVPNAGEPATATATVRADAPKRRTPARRELAAEGAASSTRPLGGPLEGPAPDARLTEDLPTAGMPPPGAMTSDSRVGRDEAGEGSGRRETEVAAAAVPIRERALELAGVDGGGRGATATASDTAARSERPSTVAGAATWPGLPAWANPTPAERRYLARYFDPTLERR